MLVCKVCLKLKPESEFYVSNHATCKECCCARARNTRPSRANPTPRTLVCTECGRTFETPRRSGPAPKYCSRECKDAPKLRREKALRAAERAERPPASPVRFSQCIDCGGWVCSKGYKPCLRCPLCRYAKRLLDCNEQWHRRRALQLGAEAEHIDRDVVLDRDGWVCQLCGEPIVLPGGREPGSPSVDHIVPLARGGSHTYNNVQAAHFGCNAAKSDRIEKED